MSDLLYTCSQWQTEAGSASCNVSYKADHPIFAGHFPGQPVVPGVCTMAMIKDLLELATGKKLVLRHAANVKFLRLILPDVQPAVSLSWKETEAGYELNAVLKQNDTALFKMTGLFGNFETA